MDALYPLLGEVSPLTWWTIAAVAAVGALFEFSRIFRSVSDPLRSQLGASDEAQPHADSQPNAASLIDADGGEPSIARRLGRVAAQALATGAALIAGDLSFGTWGMLTMLAIGGLALAFGQIQRQTERAEMLERQISDHDPSRDDAFDRSAWLNIPAEAVWGLLAAIALIAVTVGMILAID